MRQLSWDSLLRDEPGEPGEPPDQPSDGTIILCSGARATERRLLEQVQRLQQDTRDRPALLRQPVLIVVSSAALREHLVRAIAGHLGGAVVGISVLTLRGLATRVLSQAGESTSSHDQLFELIARREVAASEQFAQLLGDFDDGYGFAVASMRDLLSAGYSSDDEEPLAEACRTAGGGAAGLAEAVLGATARTWLEMRRVGLRRSGDLLEAAAAVLAEQNERVLRSRLLLVHGFSDATGQATRLLQQLLRLGARVYLDQPPRPLQAPPAASEPFSQRLLTALRLAAPAERLDSTSAAAPGPADVAVFDAADAQSEVDEVAHRINELVAKGVQWERIGVVARDLAAYALPLRRAFRRRGVPFSGGSLPEGALIAQQRWRAAVGLICSGDQCGIDRWLELYAANEGNTSPGTTGAAMLQRLRWALRALGSARIADLLQPELEAQLQQAGNSLPRFRSFALSEDPSEDPAEDSGAAVDADAPLNEETEEQGEWTVDEPLSQQAIARLLRDGRLLCQGFATWPSRASLGEHLEHARRLLGLPTGPPEGSGAPGDDTHTRLAALAALAPGDFELSRDEFCWLLRKHAPSPAPLGGRGGGVQLLDVTHARSLTFEHLFVIGMNRGVFPRPVSDDPLLPDRHRMALQAILPDLQAKGRGLAEECHLFDDLLSAAPRVTLSWLRGADRGGGASASSLIGRLDPNWVKRTVQVPANPSARLAPPFAGGASRPRSAAELMQLAAIHADDAALQQLAGLQLQESRQVAGLGAALAAALNDASDEVARARLRLLAQRDSAQPSNTPEIGGHGLGLIGPMLGDHDPRREPLYITTLELYAACPWQALLRRLLRLQPVADPLARLPYIEARMVGNAVHRALERLVQAANAPARRETRAHLVGRPLEQAVVEATHTAAREIGAAAGLLMPALQRALAALALPFVNRALEIDWPHAHAQVEVAAVEHTQALQLHSDALDGQRDVAFKVDRIDQHGSMRVLTDYKTGPPLSSARRASTRRRHLHEAVLRGQRLQLAAYAAVGGEATPGVGRLLHLGHEVPLELSAVELEANDPIVRAELPRVLQTLLDAWEQGVFFPRLEDSKGREPARCRRCELAESCVRGDSASRARLRSTASRLSADRSAGQLGSTAVRLWADLWEMGS